MPTVAVILAVVAVGAAFTALTVALIAPGRGAPKVRERVQVNTRAPDDVTVRGVLVERGRRWVVLESAEVRGTDGSYAPIDGRTHIPAECVLTISIL